MQDSVKGYSIGEVARQTGLAPHVLRYWETEFEMLRPRKDAAGRRRYSEEDLALVREIQYLLHVERYTIEGARRVLARRRRPEQAAMRAQLLALRAFLVDLLRYLEGQDSCEEPAKGNSGTD
ncbi:MerR family transcriptional regulator [Rhodothermus profundi]|uniref:DNA-binding transcriptional regulator, MerR family n=1 Tax=Rhodothermus profundi TaxID=633813 RepID=A0A1M6SET6_9BACT|nr:MerR family transcriptional regulator [Rhodothermus profundi]SHK43008.1 DNA-binding transcriptional regulator, MerR family [Rhodothermus profundi]